jgi:glycosyltransferase involved in cell wall biosynthesis
MKKVCVCIATHSGVHYLNRCILSIKKQFPVEIFTFDIIVNVNSTNEKYYDEVKKNIIDKSVQIYNTKSNGYPGKAHNTNINFFRKHKEYDYMFMIDHDDIYYPCAFQLFEKCIKKDIDVLHLMINDIITYRDIPKLLKLQAAGNIKIYSALHHEKNWWEIKKDVINPYQNPIHKCKTPSRILILSRKSIDELELKYNEDVKLFDDYQVILELIYHQYTKNKLNINGCSNTFIYAYDAINDSSATKNFTQNFFQEENFLFHKHADKYKNILIKKWNPEKWNYIELGIPSNFSIIDKAYYISEMFTNFYMKYYIENYNNISDLKEKYNILTKLFTIHIPNENVFEQFLLLSLQFNQNKNQLKKIYFEYINRFNIPEIKKKQMMYNIFGYIIKNPVFELKQEKPNKIKNVKRVVIYTGYSPPFNGKTYGENLAYGSEITALKIAENFGMDYETYVVCNTNEKITYNNVNYISLDDYYNFDKEVDILIISRFIHHFLEYKVNAKKVLYWLHDLDFHYHWKDKQIPNRAINLRNNIDSLVDNYICVSEWHKQQIINNYKVDSNKIIVIPNGIDTTKLKSIKPQERIKERIIWCSDPSRGLDILLKNFDKIINVLPNIQLHIFFHNIPDWIKILIKNEWKNRIIIHQKVSQEKLWEEMQKSEYFIYTNRSHETFCLSALEAYSNGCKVICNGFSGIGELVDNLGGYTIKNHNIEQNEWFTELINIIKKIHNNQEQKKDVENYDWNNIYKKYWKNII